MPAARSLKDLLRIRHANRAYINRLNDTLGSALGFKKHSGDDAPSDEPAVIVFVPRKIEPKWLSSEQLIKKELEGPDGLRCPVDVVEGGKHEDTTIWAHDEVSGQDYPIGWHALMGPRGLSKGKLELREVLRGWTKRVTPGAQLAAEDQDGNGYYGTLGCFARHRDGRLGFITNHHVAGDPDNVLYFPETNGVPIGIVSQVREWTSDQRRFAGIIDERRASYALDCAFVELTADVSDADIDPRLPVLHAAGEISYEELGEPLALDLDTMGPLGRRIVGVGRTRSFQQGTIVAFGYEYYDEGSVSRYTDYLIAGTDDDEFSDHGDSGKLIVTDDADRRPVALLWGGWREQLRSGRAQENWTYAIDINQVLRALDVEIVSRLDS